MTRTKSILLATCIAIALPWRPLPLNAATITTGKQPDGGPTVYFSGDIDNESVAKFGEIILRIARHNVFVYLESAGGNVEAALSMAGMIKIVTAQTVVTKHCASMCAVVWLAGSPRWVVSGAHIGFHAAYLSDEDGNNLGVSPGGNAIIGAFLGKLGYSNETIRRLTETDPESMYWLTRETAKELGIEAKIIEPKR